MFNMVRADLKRILLGKAIYRGIAFMFVYMFFMLVIVDFSPGELSPLYGAFTQGEMTTTMILMTNTGMVGYLSVLPMLMIVGDDFKEGTLKNTICVGLSRTQFYLAKFTLAMMLAILIFIVYNIGGAGLLTFSQGVHFNYTAGDLLALLPAFGLQLLLFLACTSIGVCFLFITQKPGWVYSLMIILNLPFFIVAIVHNFFPPIWHLLYIDAFHSISTVVNFANLPTSEIYRLLIVGLVYFIISTALGLFLFNRRDIK